MYEKEVVDQAAKVERMKQEGKDEYDIRKQVSNLSPPLPLSTNSNARHLGVSLS